MAPRDESDYEDRRRRRRTDSADPRDRPRERDRDRSRGYDRHKSREHRHSRNRSSRRPESGSESAGASANPLSSAALAQLNKENAKRGAQNIKREARRRNPTEVVSERDIQWEREQQRERERVRAERKARRERDRTRERVAVPVESDRDDEGYDYPPRSRQHLKPSSRDARYRRADGDDFGEYSDDYYRPPARRRSHSGRDRERDMNRDKDRKSRGRVVSGALVEEGRAKRRVSHNLRGGAAVLSSSYDSLDKEDLDDDRPPAKSRKKLWLMVGIGVVILIIIIVVAVVVSKKNSGGDDEDQPESVDQGLGSISPSDIPDGAPSWLNPFQWADTKGFNLTYTDETVGDLPVMGLYSEWDDSAAPNDRVPPLNKPWGDYTKNPARGVNVGGWLSLEPFITPSLFNYDTRMGIIDEWTLCEHLGRRAPGILEKHYSTFVTEDTFREIADAGLDHVRIPFGYWAVQTYDGDPFLFRTSWRYLLRAIEWARKYGLRINLDLHGLPGSQNGWNHSGRQGAIGWLNGTDGTLNAQRSLEIHDRLSKFFAQDRYKNIITHYGLANEPKMTELSVAAVNQWTEDAYAKVRANGVKDAIVVFGDGFRGLGNWQGELTTLKNAALDVHQYVIFNTNQIVFSHKEKVKYACTGWTEQTERSMNRNTGFGPTLVAEWSQADTDCTKHLTNVGWGNRWTGTYVTGNASLDIITPRCPLKDRRCDCRPAVAPAENWSDSYKLFLRLFAEAQMHSFEKGWGWFYWVWDTEDA